MLGLFGSLKKAVVVALLGYLAMAICGYFAFNAFWANHRDRQVKLLISQVESVAAWYDSMFGSLSDSTGILKTEFENDPLAWREAPDRLRKFSETIGRRNAWVPQISITNEKGILIASNLPTAKGTDISDRWHFRVHKEGVIDGLYISDVVVGRTTGKAVIQFTRALRSPDGVFRGITVFSISVDHIANLSRNNAIIGEQKLQLARPEGGIVFTVLNDNLDVTPGQKLEQEEQEFLRDALLLDRPLVRHGASQWDIVVFKRLSDFRLVLKVESKNILGGPDEREILILGLCLTLALAVFWLVIVVAAYRARRAR